MIHSKLINFFKEHNLYDEEMFDYFDKHAFYYDYRVEENRIFTGCFPGLDKSKIIRKVNIGVPFIMDEKTLLINIHEYTHAIEFYKNMGKKYKPDKYVEVLPMMFELLYIKEHPNKELEEYEKYLNSCISRHNTEYVLGAKMQEELANSYKYEDYNILRKKIKKLGRKIK